MTINVCGENVEVCGYLRYINDFEENVNKGRFSDAYSVLVDYIEGLLTYASGSCSFNIHKGSKAFYFTVREGEENIIDYDGMGDVVSWSYTMLLKS